MTIEFLLESFIEQIANDLRRSKVEAKQIVRRATVDQVKKDGFVTLECDGISYQFSKAEYDTAWKNL